MAKTGTKHELAVRHEKTVAKAYPRGKRSSTSGASPVDKGDVKVVADNTLFECKGRFGELAGKVPVRATLVTQMEKIANEAWESLKDPAIALRFYMPNSFLADEDGWVDLVVRRMDDDAVRSRRIRDLEEMAEECRLWH